MLARVLAIVLVCLSVCVHLSQVGVLSKGMNGLIWFWHGGFFDQSYTVLSKFGYFENIGTLPQTLDLENFATVGRSSKCVVNLARERWTLRAR